jgi:hypothetical protein
MTIPQNLLKAAESYDAPPPQGSEGTLNPLFQELFLEYHVIDPGAARAVGGAHE